MKNTSTKDKKEYLKRYREKNKENLQNKHNNRCDMDCFNCIYDDCIMP